MKKCSKCGVEKEECEFFFKNQEKKILHSQCKECKRKLDMDAYHKNRHNRKEKIRKRAIESKSYLINYVNDIKKKSKCSKCGEDRWYVLDFHHLNDKEENISVLIGRGSLKKIQNEIEKCVILCSNCHRELHHFERNMVP